MMGYAMFDQTTKGILSRQFSRSFVVSTTPPSLLNSSSIFAFVSTDTCMMFHSVKQEVLFRLEKKFPGIYSHSNLMISATHTHATPAGFSHYLLYNLNSWGFYSEYWESMVSGIFNSVVMAHVSLSPGNIFLSRSNLFNASISRSPSAYANDPEKEKEKYEFNVDKAMTQLRFALLNGTEIASFNWFAVHGVSLNNTNRLISSDNKGTASYLFEKRVNGENTLPGKGPFVAGFAQSNEGDSTPNTRGAFCRNDRSQRCDMVHSTCNGSAELCQGYGPGRNDIESNSIIGSMQFKAAYKLWSSSKSNGVSLKPTQIAHIHTFVDMSKVSIAGTKNTTCAAALGDSFAAGTTDGPGDFDFVQGTNNYSTNVYWNYLSKFVFSPSKRLLECQAPKPVLLPVGELSFPTLWVPQILPLQIVLIGQLAIVGVPGEFTTMSGRRLRNTIQGVLSKEIPDVVVVIAGLANHYSHYITTFEEYQVQRYEGASTLFGPHTLAAYQQEYQRLAKLLLSRQLPAPGPTPPDLSGDQFSFLPPVIVDGVPFGKSFGDVIQDPNESYEVGDQVQVSFWGANPRNNFRIQQTFLAIESLDTPTTNWRTVFVDSDPSTQFLWQRSGIDHSIIVIKWDIPETLTPGQYRIKCFGDSKSLFGKISPYTGISRVFQVTRKPVH